MAGDETYGGIAPMSARSSRGLNRRESVFASLTAIYFAAVMAFVVFGRPAGHENTETPAWFASIVVGLIAAGILAGVRYIDGTIWRAAGIVTFFSLLGLYVPFAASDACSAVADAGGCASSGAAAVVAACIPLYFALILPIGAGRWIATRRDWTVGRR